jgi:hypothetical protein
MATISQRITLDGAEDIRKKLEALGAAGEKAFKQIQDAAKKPIVDPAQIDRSKQAFDQLAAAATQAGNAIAQAGQQTQVAGEQAGTALQSAAVKFGLAAAGIVTVIGAIARSLVSGVGDAAQKIQDEADRLGFTVEQWIALSRGVAAAGNSVDKFADSIAPLMANLNRLTIESGTTWTTFADGARVAVITTAKLSVQSQLLVDALLKLGVRRDIIDKGQVAILHEVARIIDGMPEGTAKAAAGVQFFGAKWRDTVADLTAGLNAVGDTAEQLDQMRRASRELRPEQQKAAKAAKDAWEDVGNALIGVKNKIGAFLAPTSTANAKWLSNLIDDSRRLFETWSKLDEAGRASFLANLDAGPAETIFKTLITVGQTLASIWSDVLVPAGKALFSIVTALAGPLKELAVAVINAFKAGDQQGAQPSWLTSLGEGIKQLAKEVPDIIKQVGTAIKGLGTGLDWIAEKINGMFGTKFTGNGLAAILILDNMTGALRLQEIALATVAAGLVALNASIMIIAGSLGILNAAITLGTRLWNAFTFACGLAAAAIRGFGTALVFLAANPLAAVIMLAVAAIALLVVALARLDWNKMGEEANAAWAWVKAGAEAVKQFIENWVVTPVGNAWQWIKDTFWSSVSFVQTMMDTVTGWIQKWVTTPIANAWQWIKDTFWAVVRSLTSGGGGTPGETTPAPGHARGGLLGGRGTGTSDSILVWVSRGEHIMPARAVAQPGVLAFLEALRRSGGDLRWAIDRMGHFATGGLVAMPALASGGLGGMHPVTIQFPGLAPISGLRASSDVVEQLQRSAAMAQVRSGGRKPSRYT